MKSCLLSILEEPEITLPPLTCASNFLGKNTTTFGAVFSMQPDQPSASFDAVDSRYFCKEIVRRKEEKRPPPFLKKQNIPKIWGSSALTIVLPLTVF